LKRDSGMANKLDVTFEGDHILVISEGDKNYEFATELWTRVAELCREHQCSDVLGLARSTTPLEAIEGYDHARLFRELEIPANIRIAWFEANADAADIASFIELVLSNRGYAVRTFESEAEARAWLLEG